MIKQAAVDAFWESFLDTLPEGTEAAPREYTVWHFGDHERTANELGDLARNGIKTATCSLVWAYAAENEALPKAGDLSLITDWAGEPLCIIETTEVQVKAFDEVGEEHAYDEGEGDRSLAYWRRVHWEVFSRECSTIGREPSEKMPLLCEHFRVLFPRVEA